jgi:hypothetical protein
MEVPLQQAHRVVRPYVLAALHLQEDSCYSLSVGGSGVHRATVQQEGLGN